MANERICMTLEQRVLRRGALVGALAVFVVTIAAIVAEMCIRDRQIDALVKKFEKVTPWSAKSACRCGMVVTVSSLSLIHI